MLTNFFDIFFLNERQGNKETKYLTMGKARKTLKKALGLRAYIVREEERE